MKFCSNLNFFFLVCIALCPLFVLSYAISAIHIWTCSLHNLVVNMSVFCVYFCWAESRCRSVSPDHHPWAGERGRLHHPLHGLLRRCVAKEGGEDSGYVCMPGPLRPVSVGMYSRHGAAGGHSGVSPQLVEPSQTADGLGLLHDPLQLHVVCLRILRSAGWVCAWACDMLCAGRRKEIQEREKVEISRTAGQKDNFKCSLSV